MFPGALSIPRLAASDARGGGGAGAALSGIPCPDPGWPHGPIEPLYGNTPPPPGKRTENSLSSADDYLKANDWHLKAGKELKPSCSIAKIFKPGYNLKLSGINSLIYICTLVLWPCLNSYYLDLNDNYSKK